MMVKDKLFAFSLENNRNRGCVATKRVFNVINVLGSGASATVLKATTNRFPKQIVAIKLFNEEYIDDNMFLEKEINILQKLNHPNVAKLKMIIASRTRDCKTFVCGLALDYCDMGDLFEYMSYSTGVEMSIQFIRSIFQQIVRALAYLHSQRVVHNDIKPENILFESNGLVVLTDFGLSQYVDTISKSNSETSISFHSLNSILSTSSQRKRRQSSVSFSDEVDVYNANAVRPRERSTTCLKRESLVISAFPGTFLYSAPETGVGKETVYDGAGADMWSLGVVLHEMLFGEWPKNARRREDYFPEEIKEDDETEALNLYIEDSKVTVRSSSYEDQAAISISERLLDNDVTKRYTARSLGQHRWVNASSLIGSCYIIRYELSKLQQFREETI